MSDDTRFLPPRDALRWLLVLPAFPLSGLLVTIVIGPITSVGSAIVGGVIVGLIVGASQLWGLRGRTHPVRWVVASALGGGAGLAVGSGFVGYGATLPDLTTQGLLTGVVIGIAQAATLPPTSRHGVWAIGTGLIWALGWATTSLVGVDVERHYPVFGASGALVATLCFAALTAVSLPKARRTSPTATPSTSNLTPTKGVAS
jgi:hypothetical protein